MRRTKFLVGVFFVAMFFCAISGKAEIRPGALTLSPFVGGYTFEGNQDIEDHFTYGFGVGYQFTRNWATELSFNCMETDLDVSPREDVWVYNYRLDALYNIFPTKRVVPYFALGIGVIDFSPDDTKSETHFTNNWGAGLKIFLTDNTAFRVDARHIISWYGGDEYNNLLYTCGFVMQVGGTPAKVAEGPTDSDGDGVYDDQDRCPGTPRGVKVDSFGCPLDSDKDGVYDYLDKCPDTPRGVKVDSKGCPLDSDGDGVPDGLDKCPNTPKGVKVDKTGCPLVMDGDGDGVPDNVDKCPRTPKGATVNEFGCWICKDINFDFNKWEIKPKFYKSLDEQVSFLKQNSELIVEIQGHTDNLGTLEANQTVSERRANAVRDYFMEKGVPANRLIAKGYNYSVPLTSNDTKEGRAKNRRVQLSACYDLMVE